jgi:hypothetical protein
MSRLLATRSLKCHFGGGVATEWTKNQPKTSPERFDLDVHFDAIDYKNRTARIISNNGASEVKIVTNGESVSFIEVAAAAVDVTTVFAVYGSDRDFIAVDTRHLAFLGRSMAEQYYGSCRVWQ